MARNRSVSTVWRATAPVLAVQGGAGRIVPEEFSAQRVDETRRGLGQSLAAGMAVLRDGGSALDAVVAAVLVLEDDEQFNAGRGAVLTASGGVEHDAAVADGMTRRAGAVTCVSGIRNPVLAARAVLQRTPHVLMSGAGAQALARREDLAFMPVDWFVTARRQDQLTGILPSDRAESGVTGETVGAVALDGEGHLAAATSTGGTTGQLAGRVGDTPLVGAGTWADDRCCAVSATGDGGALILSVFAHEVDALVRLAGLSLGAACQRALQELAARAGTGGCIAVGADGTVAMPFTSAGMFRGWADATGVRWIGMFAEDLTAC
ncbi:MAG TPA: isoaspartyl peptidase/L-asparaginase [Pseudonocardiaceae bacterium]|nr:isoaspartyl peptidase/L-asparaginase [Pseudonocardiaceae bacterium]